jgi:hypothetical protein
MTESDPELEQRIAAFSRANHHRWAIAYGLAGLACFVLAIVLAFIAYQTPPDAEISYRHRGAPYKAWVYAGGAVIVGAVLLWRAVGVWRGMRDDIDG